MLLGELCTRGCSFCSVKTSRRGEELDPEEPQKVVEAVRAMGLSYVVLTSVDRDDLPDGGAGHFARTVAALKEQVPGILVETLVSDFRGDPRAIDVVAQCGADVLAHNLETVRCLTPAVRDPRASYAQSLEVLRRLRLQGGGKLTKSSLMLGLGESEEDLEEAFLDLREAGVDLLTLGQYLRPTPRHRAVARFVEPEEFRRLGEKARGFGFLEVFSGPFVRSSYRAGELFVESRLRGRRSG
jgi:lipoic acid synthetase